MESLTLGFQAPYRVGTGGGKKQKPDVAWPKRIPGPSPLVIPEVENTEDLGLGDQGGGRIEPMKEPLSGLDDSDLKMLRVMGPQGRKVHMRRIALILLEAHTEPGEPGRGLRIVGAHSWQEAMKTTGKAWKAPT